MKKTFMKKRLCLAAAALTLTAGVSAGSAMHILLRMPQQPEVHR